MNEIAGDLIATGLKIAVVVSRFNSFLTDQLVKGAVDAFVRHGGDEAALTLVKVPGTYEIPLAAQQLAAKGEVDAVVALGAVVQGATPHAALINGTVSEALARIALKTGVPVLDGVVAADSLEQAVERCGTKQGNKGASSMISAIEMVNVLKRI